MSKPSRLLLGLVTILPTIYVVVLVVSIFSLTAEESATQQSQQNQNEKLYAGNVIDVGELEEKINNSELRELRLTRDEITASGRDGGTYLVRTSDGRVRARIISEGEALDVNRNPRVPVIDDASESDVDISRMMLEGPPALFPLHGLAAVLMLGLMAYYIALIFRNPLLSQPMTVIWVILICVLSVWVMPIYWLAYVWRDSNASAVAAI